MCIRDSVCNDVFIHHFGSRSFVANNVDYSATMNANWERFARKWGFTGPLPAAGYNGAEAHARGFRRAEHYHSLPAVRETQGGPIEEAPADPLQSARAIFGVAVRNEADWTEAAQFVRRFASAFRLDDGVALAIAAFGEPDATTIGGRVERILDKAGVTPAQCADIDIADYEDEQMWMTQLRDARWIDVRTLRDRSPSALRREIGVAAK